MRRVGISPAAYIFPFTYARLCIRQNASVEKGDIRPNGGNRIYRETHTPKFGIGRYKTAKFDKKKKYPLR